MQPDAQVARARAGRQRPSAARRQRQAGGQKVGRLLTAQGPAGGAEITQLALDGHFSESVARRLGLAGPHRCPVVVIHSKSANSATKPYCQGRKEQGG